MKLFYSWQSDIPADRNYINRRLEQAISRVTGWEVDTAVRNTRGSVDIAATILAKIDECDLFFADIGIINPEAATRKSPNPNVMYELGYAVAAKGEDNIVLIANRATTNTANLPFDVRNRNIILREFNDRNKETITQEIATILQNHLGQGSNNDTPKFELTNTNHDGWANWGGPGQGSGFRYHLDIDNYDGQRDYISDIKVEAFDSNANPWATTHFKFDSLEANQRLRIEANEMLDAWVFLTDAPGQTQRPFRELGLDEDRVNLVITLRSDGRQVVIPIPPGQLVNN